MTPPNDETSLDLSDLFAKIREFHQAQIAAIRLHIELAPMLLAAKGKMRVNEFADLVARESDLTTSECKSMMRLAPHVPEVADALADAKAPPVSVAKCLRQLVKKPHKSETKTASAQSDEAPMTTDAKPSSEKADGISTPESDFSDDQIQIAELRRDSAALKKKIVLMRSAGEIAIKTAIAAGGKIPPEVFRAFDITCLDPILAKPNPRRKAADQLALSLANSA